MTPPFPTMQPAEEKVLEAGGLTRPFDFEQLKAGRNNQVFLVRDDEGTKAVLKRYFRHEHDQRDRFDHELRFLDYAGDVASPYVPRVLGSSREEGISVLEFLEGGLFEAAPDSRSVEDAIGFVEALNRGDREERMRDLPMAADACLSLQDSIDLLEARIDRLAMLSDETDLDREARDFADSVLRRSTMDFLRGITLSPEEGNPSVAVASPSDFGFHNAIRSREGGVKFLDFEYAGRDGAGKLLSDFFSQPQFRVPETFLPRFLESLAGILPGEEFDWLERRTKFLLAIHALKWACILLNGFVRVDAARRAFSGDDSHKREQLEFARKYFEEVCAERIDSALD